MAITINDPKSRKFSALTPEDVDHWMKYGYVVIRNAFSEDKAREWSKGLWTRLGYSLDDKSSWILDRVNMPVHNWEVCETFAPKAWAAICDLSGGSDRLPETGVPFGDNFICNFGRDEFVGQDIDPRTLDNWHVDDDSFTHFLDSPEQSLLLIPLFSNIKPGGGGTVICPDGISVIARHLLEHPEGVSPRMVPQGEKPQHRDLDWFSEKIQQFPRDSFHEMTGNIGDVVLMHPLMLHSASRNTLRTPRVITNPRSTMKEPFQFSRENLEDYSLIELKTLDALRVTKLEYQITGKREQLNPTRTKMHEDMKQQELLRLQGKLLVANTEKGYDINRLVEDDY